MKTNPKDFQFRLGERVRWRSGANGTMRTKDGEVAEIVPAGRLPSHAWEHLHRQNGVGLPRNHQSYVVVAHGRAYWPRVNALTVVETT